MTKELNRSKAAKSHTGGIPCPGCGHRRWRQYSTRHVGNKISRVRSCAKCGHRIRTAEILESGHAPRKYWTDPGKRVVNRRKPAPGIADSA